MTTDVIFEARLSDFIEEKSKFLYHSKLHYDRLDSTGEINKISATLPPLEYFVGVPNRIQRKHFMYSIKEGDVVNGIVSTVQESGITLTLICTQTNLERQLHDLGITIFCPLHEIPLTSSHVKLIDQFSIKDIVRCVITHLMIEEEKMLGSLHNDALPVEIRNKVTLGLVSEDRLPEYYQKSINSTDEKYLSLLKHEPAFANSGALQFISEDLGIPQHEPATMMSGLSNLFSSVKTCVMLRDDQSKRWAKDYVLEGIKQFKEGNREEALRLLVKALEFDPDNIEGLVARGALYANNSDFSKAISDFDTALKIDKHHPNGRKYLYETLMAQAKIFEDKNEFNDAIAMYQRALDIDTGSLEPKECLKGLLTKISGEITERKKVTNDKASVKTEESKNKRSTSSDRKYSVSGNVKRDKYKTYSDYSSSSESSLFSSDSDLESEDNQKSKQKPFANEKAKLKPPLKIALKSSGPPVLGLKNPLATLQRKSKLQREMEQRAKQANANKSSSDSEDALTLLHKKERAGRATKKDLKKMRRLLLKAKELEKLANRVVEKHELKRHGHKSRRSRSRRRRSYSSESSDDDRRRSRRQSRSNIQEKTISSTTRSVSRTPSPKLISNADEVKVTEKPTEEKTESTDIVYYDSRGKPFIPPTKDERISEGFRKRASHGVLGLEEDFAEEAGTLVKKKTEESKDSDVFVINPYYQRFQQQKVGRPNTSTVPQQSIDSSAVASHSQIDEEQKKKMKKIAAYAKEAGGKYDVDVFVFNPGGSIRGGRGTGRGRGNFRGGMFPGSSYPQHNVNPVTFVSQDQQPKPSQFKKKKKRRPPGSKFRNIFDDSSDYSDSSSRSSVTPEPSEQKLYKPVPAPRASNVTTGSNFGMQSNTTTNASTNNKETETKGTIPGLLCKDTLAEMEKFMEELKSKKATQDPSVKTTNP